MTAQRTLSALWVCAALAAVQLVHVTESVADEPTTPSRRILLITGEDYPGHLWRETAPALLAQLLKDPRLVVDVLANLKSLSGTQLSDYSAVILHFKNYDPQVPGREALDKLKAYVRQGGGLMLLHFACGAFEELKDEYEPLAGRVWFGWEPPAGRHQHDPHGRFTVNITDTDHPVTAGMQDFETVDELYTCLEGELPIHILATAVSTVDGKTYPMAFVHQYGQGRVLHCVLGHDVAAFAADGPGELMRRGSAWIAGLEPVLAPATP